jgi:anionic cell wall polymer biosynthesis LytR-Cps2A-Psr (LCP) family protein
VQTVENVTGLTINDYVEVNFLGFVKVIDALGGVNICLAQPVDDSYSGLQLSAGQHHVDGITALAYARDRHSFATSDLARIQDQQKLLSSALTSAIHSGLLANPVKLSSFISAAVSALTVDKNLNVSALADQLRGISPQDVRFLTVPVANENYVTPDGQDAVQLDQQAAAALFGKLQNDQNVAPPTPTARASSKASPGAGTTAGATAGASPSGSAGSSASGQTAAQDACG